MENIHNNLSERFFEAVLKLENAEECQKFFSDICTIKEISDISQRLKVAEMLADDKSYQEISKQTGASTTTISRVNRSLVYGSGGYKFMLERLSKEKK